MQVDKITETISPILYRKTVKSDYITVKPGIVTGVKQVGRGWKKGKTFITLNFEASIGAGESCDSVSIKGTPNMEVTVLLQFNVTFSRLNSTIWVDKSDSHQNGRLIIHQRRRL